MNDQLELEHPSPPLIGLFAIGSGMPPPILENATEIDADGLAVDIVERSECE